MTPSAQLLPLDAFFEVTPDVGGGLVGEGVGDEFVCERAGKPLGVTFVPIFSEKNQLPYNYM